MSLVGAEFGVGAAVAALHAVRLITVLLVLPLVVRLISLDSDPDIDTLRSTQSRCPFMPRSTAQRILCSAGVIVGLLCGSSTAWAGTDTEEKGAQVYCFMRSSGNAHDVSWNAAYALIKRQSRGLFKTSPEHASVMITEAVVKDPGTFPDCGQYLGDLFGGATTATAASLGSTSTATQTDTAFSSDGYAAGGNERYSY